MLRRRRALVVSCICVPLLVACAGRDGQSSVTSLGHDGAGLGAGAPANSSTGAPEGTTRASQPADTADTKTLLSLEDDDGEVISSTATLRDGVVTMAPDPSLPGPDMIKVDAARAVTAEQNYGPSDWRISCVMGDLSDSDIYQGLGDDKKYLYTETPVWMCFQIKVPGSTSLGDAQPSNFVTFVDPTNSSELFTIQDGSTTG